MSQLSLHRLIRAPASCLRTVISVGRTSDSPPERLSLEIKIEDVRSDVRFGACSLLLKTASYKSFCTLAGNALPVHIRVAAGVGNSRCNQQLIYCRAPRKRVTPNAGL